MNPLKAVFSEAGLFLLLCCIEILLPIFAVESPLNSLVFWSLLGISLFYAKITVLGAKKVKFRVLN